MKLLSTYVVLLLGLLLAVGCEKESPSLYTSLSIRIVMPDNRPVDRLLVSDQSGFFNINSYEQVAFPAVTNNRATIRLRKGVYTVKFEVRAVYAQGDTVSLRNTDHNQIAQAVTWVADEESVIWMLNRF